MKQMAANPSHATEDPESLRHRAVLDLHWKDHLADLALKRESATSQETIVAEPGAVQQEKPVSIPPIVRVVTYKREHEVHIARMSTASMVILLLILLTLLLKPARCQTVVVKGVAKGSTSSHSATVTSVDGNHNAIDVNVAAGGGTGGGPSDAAANAAASESDTARQKVTSALRLLDTSQSAGSQLVTWEGDQTSGAWVNCKSGCSGVADTTATGTLSSACADGSINSCGANSTVSVAMAGESSASFTLAAANNLVGAVKADCSTDGGTSWFNTYLRQSATGNWVSSVSVSSTAQAYDISAFGGSSNCRVRASVATSGSASTKVRAVSQPEALSVAAGVSGSPTAPFFLQICGSDGTNCRPVDVDSSGRILLGAGSQIIGQVSINQTTPGTTNLVQESNFPATVDTNTGNASASTPRVVLATNQPAVAISAASLPLPSGAAQDSSLTTIDTDLKSNVTLHAGSNIIGNVRIDQTTPGTTNGVQPTDGTHNMPMGDASARSIHETIDNASVTVAQATASNLNSTVVGSLSDSGASATTNRVGDLPGVYRTQFPSGQTSGDDAALSVGKDGSTWVSNQPTIYPATYRACIDGLSSAASATDIAYLPGNATNTDLLTKVTVSCTQTTAGIIDLQIIKRSAADSGGTCSNMTVVPFDSRNTANSAPQSCTANPSTGSAVGDIDSVKVGCMATGTTSPNDIYIGNFRDKGVRLSGTAQEVAVNLGGVTVTGGSFDVCFEWIETTLP